MARVETDESQRPADAEQAPALTILSVVLEKHYGYIPRQLELIDALNPGADYRMLVVDNAPPGGRGLEVDDLRVTVLPGVDPAPLPLQGRGSYHHAQALNRALPHVGGRFLLVLDPDFFVIFPDWLAQALDHMRARDLRFFGAPWHYASFRKWRYFPCVHFLLIDLHKAPIARLDFTPSIVDDRRRLNSGFSSWLKRLAPVLRERLLLESRHETGWLLKRRFGAGKSDVVKPVLDIEAEFIHPKYLRSDRARRFERRLPRRWSFLPAAGTYEEPAATPDFDHPAIHAIAPEKFAWRGQAFAFHMRRNMRDKAKGRTDRHVEDEDELVQGFLRDMIARRR